MPIQSKNPATGEVEQTFDAIDAAAVDEKLGIAHEAFSSWKKTSIAERAALMQKAAEELKNNAQQ